MRRLSFRALHSIEIDAATLRQEVYASDPIGTEYRQKEILGRWMSRFAQAVRDGAEARDALEEALVGLRADIQETNKGKHSTMRVFEGYGESTLWDKYRRLVTWVG